MNDNNQNYNDMNIKKLLASAAITLPLMMNA